VTPNDFGPNEEHAPDHRLQGNRAVFELRVLRGAAAPRALPLETTQIIGRRESCSRWLPEIDLSPDKEVSARHASLFFLDGAWFLEDLGSRNGTFLEGSDVRGLGPVRVPLGARIQCGRTCMTLAFREGITARYKNASVNFRVRPFFGAAHHHSQLPLLYSFSVTNLSRDTLPAFSLRIDVTPFAKPAECEVPPLRKYEVFEPPGLSLDFRVDLLRALAETAKGEACLYSESRRLACKPITFVGPFIWSCLREDWPLLAAYCLPNSPAVETVLRTGGLLEKAAAKLHPSKLCSGLWNHLSTHFTITYTKARKAFGTQLQRIQQPNEILRARNIAGTCIDLVLFLVACFERLDLRPLVFLLCENERPYHALPALWLDRGLRHRPVVSGSARLLEKISRKELLVFESLELAEPESTLEAAVKTGLECISKAPQVFGVDICALRPPCGKILPFGNPT